MWWEFSVGAWDLNAESHTVLKFAIPAVVGCDHILGGTLDLLSVFHSLLWVVGVNIQGFPAYWVTRTHVKTGLTLPDTLHGVLHVHYHQRYGLCVRFRCFGLFHLSEDRKNGKRQKWYHWGRCITDFDGILSLQSPSRSFTWDVKTKALGGGDDRKTP